MSGCLAALVDLEKREGVVRFLVGVVEEEGMLGAECDWVSCAGVSGCTVAV